MFAPEMDGSNAIVFSWDFANFQGIMFVLWRVIYMDISVDANQKSNCFTTILDGAKRGVCIYIYIHIFVSIVGETDDIIATLRISHPTLQWKGFNFGSFLGPQNGYFSGFLGFLGYTERWLVPSSTLSTLARHEDKKCVLVSNTCVFLVYSFTTQIFF